MFNPSFWRDRRFADAVPEMINLQREMRRLFSDVVQKSPQDFSAINIWEKGEFSVVTAELPGMEPDQIDIAVSGDMLTLTGETLAEPLRK